MSFLINKAGELLSLRNEASALKTLGTLVVNWETIRSRLSDSDPGIRDILDLLILFDDRLARLRPVFNSMDLHMDAVKALSAALKQRYESEVPEPVRKLLRPVSGFSEVGSEEDSGLIAWKLLNAEGERARKLGQRDIALSLSGGADVAVELEAGDTLPDVNEDDATYFRFGFNGGVEAGANVDVPFQYGSIGLGSAASANVDLDYWQKVPAEDQDSPIVVYTGKNIGQLANPFDLGSMWNGMCRTNSRLKAVKLLTELDHESSIGLRFGSAVSLLEKDMGDATFQFDASVTRVRRFEAFVYSDGDGSDKHLVARLSRKKDRSESSSASLKIGIDLKEVAGQAQAFLGEHLQSYTALVDRYEKYLTPGTLLKMELGDRLDGLLEDALGDKPELKRLALSLTGNVDELQALKKELTDKLVNVFDSGLGIFSRKADEVVNEIVARINEALPDEFGSPAGAQAKDFLTDVIQSIKDHLAGEVGELVESGGAELNRVTSQLERFHEDIQERIDKNVNKLDKVLAPVTTFLARVDGKIEKVTKALDKAARSRLTIRFWDENSLQRTTSADVVAKFLDNGEGNKGAYKVITRGDFDEIEKLIASPPENFEFVSGEITYFIQRHKGSGIEIGLMELDVGSQSIFDSKVKVTLDMDGNLVINSSISASRQRKSAREMQRVSFLSPFDLNVARHTRNMRTQLVVSQDDKNLELEELQKFLHAFSSVDLLSGQTVLNATNQLREWREGSSRKDVKARVDVSLALDNESISRLFEKELDLTDEEFFNLVAESLYDAEVYERSSRSIDKAANKLRGLTRVSGDTAQIFLSVQPSIPKRYGSTLIRDRFIRSKFGTTHQSRQTWPLAESNDRRLKRAFAIHMYCKGFAVMLDTMRAVYDVNAAGKSGQELTDYLDEQNQLINLCLRRWIKVGQKFLWLPSDDAAEETVAFFLLFARIAELDARTDGEDSIMSVTMTLNDRDGGDVKVF